MELICREAWGARPPTGEFTSHQLERLTVHHTARLLRQNSDAPRSIRIHQDFHQVDRGWPDIAYHFLIDLDGNVYEGRPPSAVGDTGTNYDPTGHFLVSCEGNFNEQELPAAQRDALVNVLAWASEAFSIDPTTLAGHRDVASTTCPGDNLYALIESGELEQAIQSRLAFGGVAAELLCDDATFERVRAIENA